MYTRMQLHNGQQQTEASAPPSPVLSVGFWDAFAAGCMWSEPVLAALSFSPLGKDHILVLATDGSIQVKTKENTPSKKNAADGAKEQQEEQQQHLAGGGGEQQQSEENRSRYQYGRLLMRRETVPCKPEFLINKYLSLAVYSKCSLKGRWTPVVTELQLLPGQWSRPRCQLVMQPHRLYAAESGGEEAPKHRGNSPSKSTEETKRTPSEGQLPTAAAAKRAKKNNGSSNEAKDTIVYARSRGGPVATARRGVRTAIAELHLYSHHWELLARISYKSEIKTFANAKGESILFTVHLIDAQATEIRATFFGRAASHWHPRLSVGKVYTFSKGTLQRANRLHNSLPHEVQIKFDASVEIDEVGDDPSIPLQKFERVYLGDLPRFPSGSVVDVLGFVVGAKEVETVLSRTKNEQLLRRELTLLDASESPVFFTLFGAQALQVPHSALEDNPLVAIKGAKVQEYGGRSCLVSSAQMQITFLQRAHATETNRSTRAAAAPATQGQMQAEKETTEENMAHTGGSSRTQTPIFAGVAAADVQGELDWFSAKGAAILNTLEDYGPKAAFPLTLGEVGRAVQHLHLEEVGSSRAFNVIGSLLDLQGAHLFWLACPQCKRKLQKNASNISTVGLLNCTFCRKAVKPEQRWKLALKLIDSWGTLDCVALGRQGQEIMKVVDVTAEGLSKLEAGGRDTRGRTFDDILNQLIFSEFRLDLVAKCDVYKDRKTVQILVQGAVHTAEDPWLQVQDSVRLTERLLATICVAAVHLVRGTLFAWRLLPDIRRCSSWRCIER